MALAVVGNGGGGGQMVGVLERRNGGGNSRSKNNNPSLFPGFVMPRRPFFFVGMTLNAKKSAKEMITIWDLNKDRAAASRRKFRAINNASLAGGSSSVSEALVEREFRFKPTFDDYVKVMESVRTDRSKNPGFDKASDGNNIPKKKKRSSSRKDGDVGSGWSRGIFHKMEGIDNEKSDVREGNETTTGEEFVVYGGKDKDLSDGDEKGLGRHRKLVDARTRKGGWGLVEDLLEKSNGDHRKGKANRNRSNSNLKSTKEDNLNGIRAQKDPQQRVRPGSGIKLKRSNGESVNGEPREQKMDFDACSVRMQKNVLHRNAMQVVMDQDDSMRRKMDESGDDRNMSESEDLHRPGRESSPKRRDNRKMEHHLRSSKSGMLEMESGRMRQEMRAHGMEGNAMDYGRAAPKWSSVGSSTEICEGSRSQRHVGYRRDVTEEKFGSKITELRGRLGSIDMQDYKGAGRELDNIDLEDRAAFKTYEVFTDVRNRPRVLRMEMEERIQNLAKWLNATDVNMPEWQFSRMMHSAKINFTDHSILRVVQILGTFGNWRRVLQVVEWLQSRERFKSYKSRYIYTTVLNVLGKAKRPVEALNIFYAMREELSSYPDLATYHCIAVTLGQAGLMKELLDVIDCMRVAPKKKFKLGPLQKWDPCLEPDLVIYNAVLNACIQQKQWEGAFWVLQEVKKQGIQPSSTTYGLVMEVMFACGKYNLVHEFFKKVQKNFIPGNLNYKVLVSTFWREGKVDEAVLAVRDMEKRGIVGSASLYYDLARCLCSVGRCQEALLQIDKICNVANKPLVITYTGLIQACLDSGSMENATYIFNQMYNFCSPNVVTCNIMLKSYVEHGMFKEAKDLFQKILDGTHYINRKSDLRGKVVPDKFTFNTMMEACVATKNWDDLENAFQQMLHNGFHFDTKRHLYMVMEASRAGKVQLLDTTWEHLARSAREPPPPIVKERFCVKLEKGECVAAISCLNAHRRSELHAYSEKSWLYLLNVNFGRFGKDMIVRLEHEVDNLVANSNEAQPIYENLLEACRKFLYTIMRAATNQLDNHRTLSQDMQHKH